MWPQALPIDGIPLLKTEAADPSLAAKIIINQRPPSERGPPWRYCFFTHRNLQGPVMLIAQMQERLNRCKSFEESVNCILNDAIGLQGAEFGNVQLLAGDELAIVAQHGFSLQFLKTFWRVGAGDGTACGRALRAGVPIMISDVEKDSEFAPFRTHAKLAGFRGVQSTPLMGKTGPLGIVSTHFANVHQPTLIEMDALADFSNIAAECLLEHLGDRSIGTMAIQMSEELEAKMRGTKT